MIRIIRTQLGVMAAGSECVSASTAHLDRTFFIVDLYRLCHETDTLQNALAVYKPEADLRRQQYEQRCSQLIGLAQATMGLTGKYPDFLKLRGNSYAIRSLGQHYIMGLSGRPDEPSTCAVQYLKEISELFQFYYHSPSAVLKTSRGDWEIFTKAMTNIFGYILRYFFEDQHSVPAMFNPLPYINPSQRRKGGTQLYLQASRLLRACQQYYYIAGGCIMHNKAVLCTQLPPVLTEKLALVGGGGIDLNSKSILEDNITPDKVWVIDVFLSHEQDRIVDDQRKDFEELQSAYASLDKNPDISTITAPSKLRGQWHRKTTQRHRSSSSTSPFHSPTSTLQNLSKNEASLDTHDPDPIASSTPTAPHPQKESRAKSGSLRSEDAIMISPNLGMVTYTPKNNRKETQPTNSPPDSEPCNDLADCVHPSSSPPDSPRPIVQSNSEEGDVQVRPESNVLGKILESDGDTLESRPSTCSSDDFATPSHTPPPPREDSAIMKSHLKALVSDGTVSLGLNNNVERSGSFRTAYELSLSPMEDSDGAKLLETSSKQSTLKEEDTTVSRGGDSVSGDLDDDKVQKLVNSALHSSEVQRQTASVVASNIPSNMPRNWSETDSDDFVSSTELTRMLTDLEAGKRDEVEPSESTVDHMEDGRVNDEGGDVHDLPQVVVDSAERNETGVEAVSNQVQDGDEFTGSLALRDEDKSSDLQAEEEIVTEGSAVRLLDGEQETQPLEPKSGEATPFTAPLINGEMDHEDDARMVENCSGESPQCPTFSDDVIPNGDTQEEVHPSTAVPSTTAVDQMHSSEYDEPVCTSRHESQTSESPVTDAESSTPPFSDDGSTTNDVHMEEQLSCDSKVSEQLQSGVKEQESIDSSERTEVDDMEEESLRSGLESGIYLGVREPSMDGMLTPVERTLNIASLRALDLKLNDSGEYSNLDNSGGSGTETTAERPKSGTAGKRTLRAGTSELIQKTLERQAPAEVEELQLERKCLYVQRHMNTVVILLADTGLHQDHSILSSLWQSLLPQLIDLEVGMKRSDEGREDGGRREGGERRESHATRQVNHTVTFSNPERLCEAQPLSAAYHFRHALRRAHEEYQKDPSLLQIGLSKEHCRVLSQCVFEREVYFQPGKYNNSDAIAVHAFIEKYIKTKTSLRQQPLNGPKVMFL